MTPPSDLEYSVAKKICSQKDCHMAGIAQPLDNFRKPRSYKRFTGGTYPVCRSCEREYNRRYRAGHRERIRILSRVSGKRYYDTNRAKGIDISLRKRLRRQGATPHWYETTLAAQGGVCTICGGPPRGKMRLAVDHNHACCPKHHACNKCRRGLLCGVCNTKLGHLENTHWIEKATAYLARFPMSPEPEPSKGRS